MLLIQLSKQVDLICVNIDMVRRNLPICRTCSQNKISKKLSYVQDPPATLAVVEEPLVPPHSLVFVFGWNHQKSKTPEANNIKIVAQWELVCLTAYLPQHTDMA